MVLWRKDPARGDAASHAAAARVHRRGLDGVVTPRDADAGATPDGRGGEGKYIHLTPQ